MKITFHGAAQTVTGSQHLLEVNGRRLLLECGLFQGRRGETYERNRSFKFLPSQIDAVILSHAHIDHSGNLPHLVKQGFAGDIFTTPATAHLSNIMLIDSGHIQEMDAKFVNKRHERRGEAPIDPLYTQEDAAAVAQQFRSIPYNQPFQPIPGVTAQLVEAGHILGSAAIVLDIEEISANGAGRHAAGRKMRLWFSGDIGRLDLPLIRDPELPQEADLLVMECTYGDKPHRDPQDAYEEMRQVVTRTVQRGGKVIVPAFAVGRTQELVYDLNRMIANGDIPRVPVFVDSPLAVNASDIFRAHPECFDEETRDFIHSGKHKSALGFDLLTYTRSVEESKELNDRQEPMVIISASGMAEGGRILHHLRHNIEDPRSTVMIVSWQAPYTLGRRLADREKEVKIFGESFRVQAEVATIGGLSAHAGQDFLLKYAQATQGTLKDLVLVHGEPKAAGIFQEKLAEAGFSKVHYPEQHDSLEI